jgi:hypothetical protein
MSETVPQTDRDSTSFIPGLPVRVRERPLGWIFTAGGEWRPETEKDRRSALEDLAEGAEVDRTTLEGIRGLDSWADPAEAERLRAVCLKQLARHREAQRRLRDSIGRQRPGASGPRAAPTRRSYRVTRLRRPCARARSSHRVVRAVAKSAAADPDGPEPPGRRRPRSHRRIGGCQ